jgi:multiple sugar transport system ATP-binding protein
MFYVTHDQVEAMTLGHRITVLDKGRVQQIATPREVYEHPANVFVAGFIGSPPMNLFPTTVRAGERGAMEFSIGDQWLPLPSNDRATDRLRGLAGRPLTVGFRPEDARIAESAEEASIVAVVEHVESLGHETLVAMRVGKGDGAPRFIVRLPAMVGLAKGQEARLEIDTVATHWFGEDGRAL